MGSAIRIAAAAQRLRRGEVFAHATEAVWGLACDPWNSAAVLHLLALKRRPMDNGLILVAADAEVFDDVLDALPPVAKARVLASWPGPSTWIVPHHGRYPGWVTGRHRGVALRVTAHPQFAALCARFGGALVSTSANRSGRPPASDAMAVRRQFGRDTPHVLAGQPGDAARPTAIRDALTGAVLRA